MALYPLECSRAPRFEAARAFLSGQSDIPRCLEPHLGGARIVDAAADGVLAAISLSFVAPRTLRPPSARVWHPPHLHLADRALLAQRGPTCDNMAPISLGVGALVSQGAHLCAGSHDITSANFQLTLNRSPLARGHGLLPKPLSDRVWRWVKGPFWGPVISFRSGRCIMDGLWVNRRRANQTARHARRDRRHPLILSFGFIWDGWNMTAPAAFMRKCHSWLSRLQETFHAANQFAACCAGCLRHAHERLPGCMSKSGPCGSDLPRSSALNTPAVMDSSAIVEHVQPPPPCARADRRSAGRPTTWCRTRSSAPQPWRLWIVGTDLRAWLSRSCTTCSRARSDVRRRALRSTSTMWFTNCRSVDSHRDQAIDLQRCLLLLPEDQRAVLLLVALEDLSYAQVAKVLGIPVGTVMSRLSRARSRLQDLMEGTTTPTDSARACVASSNRPIAMKHAHSSRRRSARLGRPARSLAPVASRSARRTGSACAAGRRRRCGRRITPGKPAGCAGSASRPPC